MPRGPSEEESPLRIVSKGGLVDEQSVLGLVRQNEMTSERYTIGRRFYRDYKELYPASRRVGQIEQDHFRFRVQSGSAAGSGVNTPFV